ncbi:hypothetical protein F5X68DRAFT_31165 [Plectosphaerella plurivora]|uniref:AGC-kinase C-terminal domain-containing protein n=1 Tax=Plectosphaerella plurivora TaxID=936078 RepID=A0A9P8VL38_9PEZI|nr:hypothetical protein F5X68DRAFT_31165 [Plectosphaerella plurivora]
MLSHLRFHRRGPSNPSSPNPDQRSASSWENSSSQPQLPLPQDAASPIDGGPLSATSSHQPPTLPPITRVTSSDRDSGFDLPTFETTAPMPAEAQPPRQQPMRSPYTEDSGFMGGVALQKYRREQQLQQQQALGRRDSPASASTGALPRSPLEPLSARSAHDASQSRPALSPMVSTPRSASSFTSPTELSNAGAVPTHQAKTGRRPPGVRLATEPPPTLTHAPMEPSRARKGLPFLKNPMSTLLMRRKTSQNAPDIAPLPLAKPGQPSYDPRIRGTRVHDFSAPRKKPTPSPLAEHPPADVRGDLAKTSSRDTLDPNHAALQARHKSNASDSGQSSFGTASQTLPDMASASSTRTRSSHLDQKPLPGVPLTDSPPKITDAETKSMPSSTSVNEATSRSVASSLRKSAPSTRPNVSRNVSLSGSISSRDMLSSVPRHMKSTSSRFSFDMVGAAKQEKLLEERHRQRELERKTSEVETESDADPNRDSRFDDFDEDNFDYEAMMADDGLEEPIPGAGLDDYGEEEIPMNDMGYDEEEIPMNSMDYDEEEVPMNSMDYDEEEVPMNSMDYDEEEVPMNTMDYDDEEIPTSSMDYDEEEASEDLSTKIPGLRLSSGAEAAVDPDDDQENFAGFVFQRSNPTSELTTPRSAGLLITPRDADGRVIGFAMSGDAPDAHPEAHPLSQDSLHQMEFQDDIAGLGIQGLDVNKSPKSLAAEKLDIQQPTAVPPRPQDDELYFGGLLDANEFAGEGDGSTFDESLFDLEDTDKYGRPIPGAFAAAQAARAQEREGGKRTSDSTSRLSGQSEVSQSTTHTSLSGAPQVFPSALETKRESEVLSPGRMVSVGPLGPSTAPEVGSMADYQAALAAAAHRAAADGKFRRDSSPPPSDLVSPSVGRSSSFNDDSHLSSYEDYPDDDFGYDNMDDYDLDDDAIIAEANADALASDSDGWYGSEFGFYSNAGSQQRHSRDNSGSEKTFEYANGGFFGPSGVSRTKSGRVVSREPNLTPITERSEYSNRNSIMSLAVPPIGSGPSSLASPGLAQLAMMYGDDDNMSLTALMRLRSRAWGGSQLSLSSSREGSPRSERGDGASSPWGDRGGSSGNLLGVHGHARKNSAFSVRSRDFDSSEAGSASGSPTLTMSMPVIASPPPPVPPINTGSSLGTSASASSLAGPAVFEAIHETDEQPDTNVSSMSSSGLWTKSPDAMAHPNLAQSFSNSSRTRRPGMGHKHKGSADSISYVQEEESGETRWVMERRYTADTGEVEVEREVLQQGRI